MSLHSTLFAAAGIRQLLRAQGESISYAEPDEDAVSLTALVGNKRAVRKDGSKPTGSTYEHERSFSFTRDAADAEFGGVANPKKNATITYAGEEYAITGIESQSLTETQVAAGFCGQANLEAAGTRGRS